LKDWEKLRQLRKCLRDLAKKEYKDLSEADRKLLLEVSEEERLLTYKYDFLVFCMDVLNAESWGEPPQKWAPVHRRLCLFIRRCRNLGSNAFIQLPRNHLKTQITTIFYRIWVLVHNPNGCSLVVSGTLELSKSTVRMMKGILMQSDKLHRLYPQVVHETLWRDKNNKWSETQFNVLREKDYPQCTIEAVGVGATTTGKHFVEVSFDDLVTPENASTPEQCEKTVQSYRYFLSIINPQRQKGKIPILVVGTPYTDTDLYTYLKEPDIIKHFMTFIQPVYDETGKPIWPEMFNKLNLAEIESTQKTAVFSAQYLLDPIPADQLEFRREWLKFYDTLPQDINGNEIYVDRYCIVDPITAKKTSSTSVDRGVVLILGVDKTNSWYVIDYKLYARAKESEMFKGIFDMQDKHQFRLVGWESVAYQLQGKYNLEEEVKRTGRRLKVIELRPGHTNKDARIRALIPYFERGQIQIKKWMTELTQELTRFPYGSTKDIIDSLAYAPQMIPTRNAYKWARQKMLGAKSKAWYK